MILQRKAGCHLSTSTLEEYLLYEQDTPDELKDYELIEPFVSKKEWQQIIESETNTAAWSLKTHHQHSSLCDEN